MSSDIVTAEVVPSGDVAIPSSTAKELTTYRDMFDPDLAFSKLVNEVKSGYIARGFKLLTDKDGGVGKDALINVPHLVIGITYRPGFSIPGTKIRGDYISLESVVADKEFFALPQVRASLGRDIDTLAVYPNESVVYNDGGTGIRRTMTKLLHTTGVIDVGGDFKKDGDRIYDRPCELWASGAELAMSGIVADVDGEPFRYLAVRGLRRSDYKYDDNGTPQDATTYYFA